MTKPIALPVWLLLTLLSQAVAADRDPPPTSTPAQRSGPHQLLCGQITGAAVVATSGDHRLMAVLESRSSERDPVSENYRLRSSCLAGQYRREFFLQMFSDSFELP